MHDKIIPTKALEKIAITSQSRFLHALTPYDAPIPILLRLAVNQCMSSPLAAYVKHSCTYEIASITISPDIHPF